MTGPEVLNRIHLRGTDVTTEVTGGIFVIDKNYFHTIVHYCVFTTVPSFIAHIKDRKNKFGHNWFSTDQHTHYISANFYNDVLTVRHKAASIQF